MLGERAVEKIKTEKCKRRRVKLLRERTEDAQRRKVWSLKHGKDTYGIHEDDLHCKAAKELRKSHQSVKLAV